MAQYTNPEITRRTPFKQLFYLDLACAIFTCNGNPEGVIDANTGSIALSDNGLVYKKTTDNSVNGWIEIGGGSVSDVSEVIFRNSTDISNDPGGVDDTIFTIPIAAGSISQLNSFLEYCAVFTLAANANTKAIALQFGSQLLSTVSWNNSFNGLQLEIRAKLFRLTATTFRAYVTCSLPSAGNAEPFTSFADRTIVLNMDTDSIDFVVIVFGDAANDITHRMSTLSLNQ